jgi:hypothetical protein
MEDDGRQRIAIGHLSDSGDLKKAKNICKNETDTDICADPYPREDPR